MLYAFVPGTPRLLIAEDEKGLSSILAEFLTQEGYIVDVAEDGVVALEKIASTEYSLLIADLDMPRMGGMALLGKLADLKNKPIVILMTGYATVESAVEAMKMGAFDYIVKPFKMEQLLLCIQRALEKRRLEQENIQLKETLAIYNISEAFSQSLNIRSIIDLISITVQNELDADITLLSLFDTGTGALQNEKFLSRISIEREEIKKNLKMDYIKDMLEKDIPLVLSRWRLSETFRFDHPVLRCVSLMAVGIKVKNALRGAIITFSFTRGKEFTEGQRKFISVLAERAAAALENSRLYAELHKAFRETTHALMKALEAKDIYTKGHSERVVEFATMLACALSLSDTDIERISQAALLHDIGKIGIQLETLNKPEKLTEEETKMFRLHTVVGKNIVDSVTFLKDIAPYVYHHHERWDGKGYPEGKKGEEIPLGARILTIADSFTVMTEDRAYRRAFTVEEAAEELIRCKGTQFDPIFVDVFIKELKKRRILKDGFGSDAKGVPGMHTLSAGLERGDK